MSSRSVKVTAEIAVTVGDETLVLTRNEAIMLRDALSAAISPSLFVNGAPFGPFIPGPIIAQQTPQERAVDAVGRPCRCNPLGGQR